MPDLKISELTATTSLLDADITPFVQSVSSTPVTRRATVSQIRRAILADRGVDVRDFGAAGNGTTNDAPAIQAAIDSLGSAGGVVQLGPRTYRLASAIVVNSTSVRLQGAGFQEGGNPGNGTWLTVDQASFTPITFSGVAARGSVVRDIAVRQTHAASQTVSWAPTDYPYFFRVEDCLGGVDFDNVMLAGINRGIYARNSGRTDFRRIRGQVFTTGIEIDECYDTGRIQNLHFWPFWSANDNVVRWQQNNGDAFIFRRVDGIFIDQAFVLGYRSMFRFSSSAAGHTQKFSIGQAYADFVRHGVLIEAAGTDGQIDAMTVQCEIFNAGGAPLPGSIGIHINTNTSRVQIGTLRIDDAEDNPIRVEQHSNKIDIASLRCVNFNLRSNGAAAIHLANAGTGTANRVNLASAPLLETAVLGPLFNAGTNGSVGVQGPAGEAARPGVSIGQNDTGLFRPAVGSLGAAAGGSEMLRAASGSVSLGAAPGAHGLQVTTPASTVNRPEILGGVTGSPGSTGWRAQGSDANIATVIGQPKGTGALLAQFPDSLATGGNPRGANAADLQMTRSAAAQVASGINAVIGGGSGNTASGVRSSVGGGFANTASGAGSWVPGGQNATTRGIHGRGAWAGNFIAAVGDAQCGEHVLLRQTTSASALNLSCDGAAPSGANTVILPPFAAYAGVFTLVSKAMSTNDAATWRVNVSAARGSTAASAVVYEGAGTNLLPTASNGTGSAWRLAISADTTNGGINFVVTGAASTTIIHSGRFSNVEAVTAS